MPPVYELTPWRLATTVPFDRNEAEEAHSFRAGSELVFLVGGDVDDVALLEGAVLAFEDVTEAAGLPMKTPCKRVSFADLDGDV